MLVIIIHRITLEEFVVICCHILSWRYVNPVMCTNQDLNSFGYRIIKFNHIQFPYMFLFWVAVQFDIFK